MLASTATKRSRRHHPVRAGLTQHSIGSQIIRTGAMVQLLLGNIGIAGGGMNELRGHSNIQGLTDLGLMSNLLPGYMTLPNEPEQDYGKYIAARASAAASEPAQLLAELRQVPRQPDEGLRGKAATAENNWAFDYPPSSTSSTTCCRSTS